MADARTVLLTRLIDDAGLFPPARKPMAQALADHRTALGGSEGWIPGRFLCPVSRLEELGGAGPVPDWELGAIVDGADWRADLAAVAAYEGPGRITAIELRCPGDAPAEAVRATVPAGLDAFFEVSGPEGVEEIASLDGAGAKLRCGGLTAEAFPSDQAVAAFIVACVGKGCRFKATAGLHHPFRARDARLGVLQHGFLNLLAATAMTVAEPASAETGRRATAIVAERDPAAFALSETGLRWGERSAGMEALKVTRRLFVGYGSCSFEEPIEDLRSHGLLEPATARA
jgi:hypothetical protein